MYRRHQRIEDKRVQRAQLVLKVYKAFRGLLEQTGTMAQQAPKEFKEMMVPKVRKVFKE